MAARAVVAAGEAVAATALLYTHQKERSVRKKLRKSKTPQKQEQRRSVWQAKIEIRKIEIRKEELRKKRYKKNIKKGKFENNAAKKV